MNPQSTQALRRAARHPEKAIKMKSIKVETKGKMGGMGPREIRRYNAFSERRRPPWNIVVTRLGREELESQGRWGRKSHFVFAFKF